MEIGADVTAWYWRGNELRECIVASLAGEVIVLDAETLDRVEVEPSDVMIERPSDA